MKATKILIIYSLIFILLNSTIVLAEQRNGIYEPLDYLNDNTPLSIAIPSSNAWKTEISSVRNQFGVGRQRHIQRCEF